MFSSSYIQPTCIVLSPFTLSLPFPLFLSRLCERAGGTEGLSFNEIHLFLISAVLDRLSHASFVAEPTWSVQREDCL